MDYISIIRQFIDPIIANKDAVMIKEMPNEKESDKTFIICCTPEDTGRLIGKRGITADALREVLSVAGKSNKHRIHLKLESFDETQD